MKITVVTDQPWDVPADVLVVPIAADPAFGIPLHDLQAAAEPSRFVGRAPQQVEEFLDEVVAPWLARDRGSVGVEEVRV